MPQAVNAMSIDVLWRGEILIRCPRSGQKKLRCLTMLEVSASWEKQSEACRQTCRHLINASTAIQTGGDAFVLHSSRRTPQFWVGRPTE